MSFWSGLTDVAKGVSSFFSGNSLGSTLLKTAVTGFALYQVSNSINKVNDVARRGQVNTDTTVQRQETAIVNRQQVTADQNNKVPVVYGQVQLSGIITEAVMSNFNTRMTFVYTLSEHTGNKLSDGTASVFTFNDIYYNDERLVFETSGASAGVQVSHSLDREGTRNDSLAGLIRVWCYRGNSNSPVAPQGYTNGSLPVASSVVPGWTTDHAMNDLVFVVVQVDYSIDKGLTQIGNFSFDITNSMTLPGDCMLDYMTNPRYGANIDLENIFDE